MKYRLISMLCILCIFLTGCSSSPFSPSKPVSITVWHYYNGAQKTAFDKMVSEFNETVGKEQGIVLESQGHGDVGELEKSILASVNKEVGSKTLPDVFASYADTAFTVEQMGLIANLDDYFTKEELNEYVESYIQEGRIGKNGELRIFPIAKSTETFMLNKTDWEKFAAATGASVNELQTVEGITSIAKKYYEWTDSLTPNVPNDGKAFFGRDAMPNMFVIGAKQLGSEIFVVDKGEVTYNIDKSVMRKIWDNYYIPYVQGWFTEDGRFRSDDAHVGKLIALIGSSSSATYFPNEVITDTAKYPIEHMILPMPVFEGGEKYAVQQGAGMVVTKGEKANEMASTIFLKWFTDSERNLEFASDSGYLPVKKEENDFDKLSKSMEDRGVTSSQIFMDVFKEAFSTVDSYMLYTNKAFAQGTKARAVLQSSMPNKAAEDRKKVISDIEKGSTPAEAIAPFITDECFDQWFAGFESEIKSLA